MSLLNGWNLVWKKKSCLGLWYNYNCDGLPNTQVCHRLAWYAGLHLQVSSIALPGCYLPQIIKKTYWAIVTLMTLMFGDHVMAWQTMYCHGYIRVYLHECFMCKHPKQSQHTYNLYMQLYFLYDKKNFPSWHFFVKCTQWPW